nr:immunoglobulin heavy chain junction region [Mus musculus]NSM07428.1 immunoglobulin heavy chain junction region [Mus musculus]
CARSGLGPHW